jgi:hypothetical protein
MSCCHRFVGLLLSLGLLAAVPDTARAQGGAPTCTAPEALLSWPATNPVWQLCWLRPSQSSGPRGSGLELRNVYYQGRLVLKRAHSPMLFAEYTSNTCYRDWKDENSNLLAEPGMRNALGVRTGFGPTTSCDRSAAATTSYGACPFSLPGRTAADCFSGVAIEDRGDFVELSTQYIAGWYLYSARFRLHADGAIDPEFGFGNQDGTGNNTTHWHHNYWRLDFDIDGAANDVILQDAAVQSTEFAVLRCNSTTTPSCTTERTWEVRDTVTGRGYRVLPSALDYAFPTNQSGRNFHVRDVIGTAYIANEYGDNPNYSLGDCTANHAALANGGDLDGAAGEGTDVVLYYRGGVRDRTNEGAGTQDSMVCKRVGPVLVPVGDWGQSGVLFENGFEPVTR